MSKKNIFIERNSPSDEEFFIHKIFVENGVFIKKDTLIAEVEGAKAIFEIFSDQEGYFYTNYKPGDYIDIDSSFALISDVEIKDVEENNSIDGQSAELSINLSKPAEKYVVDNNIDIQSLTNFLSDIDLITIEDIKQVSKKNNKSERFEIEIKKENLESWEQLNKKEGKKPLFLIGGGYGAYQILDIIVTSSDFYLEGYFDDSEDTKLELLGIKRFGDANEETILKLLEGYEEKNVSIAVSNNTQIRKKFESLQEHGINLPKLIHPSAVIGTNVKIGDGTTIFGGVHIGADTEIGELSFISSNSTIEHHNLIGKAFCCGPGFSTSGIVQIGDFVRAGINVGVEPFLKIGNEAILASGVIITKNIEDKTIVKLNK